MSKYVSECVITGKRFEGNDSQNTAVTHIGEVWIGLWQNEPFVFDDRDMVLLPRSFIPWLEALDVDTEESFFVPENASFYVR